MEDAKHLHRRLLKFTRGDVADQGEALEVLRGLERTTVTYAILKETKMGHTVGKLRKHENEKIASLARLLVKSWKSMALSPRPSTSEPERKASSNSNINISKTETSSKATAGSNGLKTAPKPAAARTSSTPFIPAGLDKVRATVRTKLKEILEASEGGSPGEIAAAIEVAMARTYHMGAPGEQKKDYMAKYRQLSFNLKKNGDLRQNLLDDSVSGDQLIKMSAEELATEEKRAQIEKLRDDAFQEARLDWAEANHEKIQKQTGTEGTKGLFTCGRCKSSKTSNTQKQTRSADEPMTVFVMCHNCGNRWKC
ncbi:Transcription elongation factor A protein 1 [Phytophthora nicotianae]|uniref:Transcription elongation factor S-II n=2 Tax=Phytophthora nicotianae TaxID=4792 RepID=V9E0N5_PHYNI|nr:transcription elongation factor S-II [Phytophthora nicotianae P1569]KUF78627.1 Transcription elongation factor A protein 1 [Phytophthora nicotianae]KUF94711.1 Tartrate-resistant acid phosphatase type 5 [Phytophthora nicotianae]